MSSLGVAADLLLRALDPGGEAIAAVDGCHLLDREGRRYLDLGWTDGRVLLPPNHPRLLTAIEGASRLGTKEQAAQREQLAEKLRRLVALPEDPGDSQVTFLGSHREALELTAKARGDAPCLDWSRSAMRVDMQQGPAPWHCFGESLSTGLAFGAVLGPRRLAGSPASAEAVAAALCCLELLDPTNTARRLRVLGEGLGSCLLEACSQHGIEADLCGPPALLELRFHGQENASSERILRAFHEELRAAGVMAGPILYLHPFMQDEDHAFLLAALMHVVGRLRTLLTEHNSYISGGLRFPFPGNDPLFVKRGLAIYRFPSHANVQVEAQGEGISIDFGAGPLGEITSSGFYVPTLVQGDFMVTASYELGAWRPPAGEAACLALFAQTKDSSARYYAQRMSAADSPHQVLGSFRDLLGEPVGLQEGTGGQFCIRRRHGRIACWHRQSPRPGQKGWEGPGEGTGQGTEAEGDGWVPLGDAKAPGEDMIIGAKIWAKIHCEGLQAHVYNLQICATIAEDQIPPVPLRSDPRGAS